MDVSDLQIVILHRAWNVLSWEPQHILMYLCLSATPPVKESCIHYEFFPFLISNMKLASQMRYTGGLLLPLVCLKSSTFLPVVLVNEGVDSLCTRERESILMQGRRLKWGAGRGRWTKEDQVEREGFAGDVSSIQDYVGLTNHLLLPKVTC